MTSHYKPRASFSLTFSSFWIAGLTLPRRRMILLLSMVSSFLILNTEALLRPVLGKSGCSGCSRQSVLASFLGETTEEIKTMTISVSCGSRETITAGRNFIQFESVNGKVTRTMSLRLSGVFDLQSDFLSILHGVNILIGMVQEIVATSLLRCLSNKGRG